MTAGRRSSSRIRGRRPDDRALGTDRTISRRDFLNGIPLGTGALTLPGLSGWFAGGWAAEGPAGPHPPVLTGLRGAHAGSFEAAHALRDRVRRGEPREDSDAESRGEFDLVVVGGGISGLAAAFFCREATGPTASILVLDNHDDFGGAAKRNQFRYRGRTILAYGGTQSVDSPATFSAATRGRLDDLGADLEVSPTASDRELYRSRGFGSSVFFGTEDFGRDQLVSGFRRRPPAELAEEAPFGAAARRGFVRLFEYPGDPRAELSEAGKKDRLASTTYGAFLDALEMDPEVLAFCQQRPHSLYGMGRDGVPALDLWALEYPGFSAMGLPRGSHPRLSLTARPNPNPEPYIFHFPDGNATLARALIPEAAPGSSSEDIVEARLDYSTLDRSQAPCRIRLNSTAVRVRDGSSHATMTYVRDGSPVRVRTRRVVLAGYNRVIPFLLPELPPEQRGAPAHPPKVPLVYSNTLVRNRVPFVNAAASSIYPPAGFHSSTISLDFPASIGSHRFAQGPEDPIVRHAVRTPCLPGKSAQEQHRAGQSQLLRATFETRETRTQLARALGPFGSTPRETFRVSP